MQHAPGSRPVTLASVPSGHPYVRAAVADPPAVLVPPDPVPDPAEPARWWPHPYLESGAVAGLATWADAVHVHFGYEHLDPAELRRWTEALRGAGLPLVTTVHDLTNPHTADHDAHLERTGVLVRAADGVVTLTPGAAAEIRERWGVDARVLAHPPLPLAGPADAAAGRRRTPPVRGARVGVFLGVLRAGTACAELLPPLAEACGRLDAHLEVHVPRRVLDGLADPGHPRHAELRALRALPPGVLRSGPRPDDAELARLLADLDVLVLPHRHGTHSGWLEAARDLGTRVVVPRTGHLPDQWAYGSADGAGAGGATWSWSESDRVEALHRALREVLTGPPVADRARHTTPGAVRAAHRAEFERVLGARR